MCWNISLLGREEVKFLCLSVFVSIQFSFICLVFTTTVTSVVLERKPNSCVNSEFNKEPLKRRLEWIHMRLGYSALHMDESGLSTATGK